MTMPTQEIQILLADLDTAFCVAARHTLEKLGMRVTLAHDGADLLARFTPDQFDVVIAGVALRRPSGLEILRHVKKNAPAFPVILLCDQESLALAEQGAKEGAFAYVQTTQDELEDLGEIILEALDAATVEDEENLALPAAADDLALGDEDPLADTDESARSNDTHTLPLQLMHELIPTITATPLTDILETIAKASARILNAAHAVILLLHTTTGYQIVTPYESSGSRDPVREFIERPREGFAARIANAGKTLLDALARQPGALPLQFIGTPILKRKKMIGILIAYAFPPDQPMNLDRITWFELFAAQAALAIEFDQLKQENAHLAPDDPITGALKREVFLEMADREFRRSWRYNHALTAIVVDIDGMNIINLKYGHEFGNVVMREVTNVCRNVVRSIDLIGRYEGDALALGLLMTGADGARTVAERLRVGINAIRLGSTEGLVQITAAIGVCIYPRNGCASIFDLLTLAQQAQQTARHQGLNQIAYV